MLIVQAVGDAFNNGFYEEQVKLRSLPLLESRPERFMRNMAAKDAISTRKVRCFLCIVEKIRILSNRCFEVDLIAGNHRLLLLKGNPLVS